MCMCRRFYSLAFLLTLLLVSTISSATENSLTIALGSCAEQNKEQHIWNSISKMDPDLFIFMGDNVYIDSADPKDMNAAYSMLSSNPNFAKFKKSIPIVATWDDHDYGLTDGGKGFVGKMDAKKAFVRFFDYPELTQISEHDRGIYHTKELSINGKKIQIILLDTRWYRDDLQKGFLNKEQREKLNLGSHQPSWDKNKTMLGEQQWDWLKSELQKSFDFRIIVSSIQVISEYTGWESWANLPFERKKLLDMVYDFTDNTVFVSGDVHRAEISKLKYKDKTFIEITSSGLASRVYPAAPNKHRVKDAVIAENFATLNFSDDKNLKVLGSIFDSKGKLKLSINIPAKN